MQNEKQETVIFGEWEDILAVMISGRRFEYEGVEYHYQRDEPKGFQWHQGTKDGKLCEDGGFIGNMDAVSKLLVGSELIEVDPQFIRVDTLLLVSDDLDAFSTDSTTVPKKRYFSHWHKGRVRTFKNGATSLTSHGTMGWHHWKVAPGGK